MNERTMDGLEQWKHLLMQIAHGSEPTEQLAARVRAEIEQLGWSEGR